METSLSNNYATNNSKETYQEGGKKQFSFGHVKFLWPLSTYHSPNFLKAPTLKFILVQHMTIEIKFVLL